jgi:hypothetical protein
MIRTGGLLMLPEYVDDLKTIHEFINVFEAGVQKIEIKLLFFYV